MEDLKRPPVVVVLGHVDHGKTSLLDAIRQTSVTKREAGGITQSIGASHVAGITFIDTPGHALFGGMRSRGVTLADIGILVVAADDGVQPQTKEAIKLLQESQIPFVVGITKVDLKTGNVENVLQQLEKEGVYLERRGGDVSYLGISVRTGEGMKELLELINLLAEMNEIKGDPTGKLEGFVIETRKDKRGLMVSLIVKNGKVAIGNTVFAESVKAKVKGIFDDNLKPIKEILPGFPGQVLGFEELPWVGCRISDQMGEERQKTVTEARRNDEARIKIFVKAKTMGSLEALEANVPEGVTIVGSGVGDVTPADVFFAKAAGAAIFLFESQYSTTIRKLSETEGVKIERFEVVYDLIEKLKELIKGGQEEIKGRAQIVASFPFNGKKVAGSKIMRGSIGKGDRLKLMRNEKELGRVKVVSIRKQKDEVNEVKEGEECGIYFVPQLDFMESDVLLSVNSER